MIAHYRTEVKEVPGTADTFRCCHEHGIKVATDTGFHGKITEAIMEGLGWGKDGLVLHLINLIRYNLIEVK